MYVLPIHKSVEKNGVVAAEDEDEVEPALREEIDGVKAKIASGEQPVFDSVDALFDKLEAE